MVGLAALPGGALVASVDAAGALHLWSAATGALARRFAEPATPTELAQGPGAPPARGSLIDFMTWHPPREIGQFRHVTHFEVAGLIVQAGTDGTRVAT